MGRKRGSKTAKRRAFYLYERHEVLLRLIADKMNEDQSRDRDANDSDAMRDCISGSMQRYGITKTDLTAAMEKSNVAKPAAD